MRVRYCVFISLMALFAEAQEPAQPKPASRFPALDEIMRVRALESRALALRPRRQDTPLRQLNITDNEVREIEAVARRELLSSMLNISPVIAGCPCEDGPFCTDQVYVVATAADETVGLQLSHIRNAWVVGPVQQWWARYLALGRRASKMDFLEFFEARSALLREFPMCVGSDPPAAEKTAQTK